MTIQDLIERVEAATGPDEAIDLEIARLQDTVCLRRNLADTGNEEFTHWRYTASIDAALTLVPDGWEYCIYGGNPNCTDSVEIGPISGRGQFMNVEYEAGAPTAALAICAAALKARVA